MEIGEYFSITNLKNKVWDSPTFTTWGSLLAKSLDIVVIMPLLVTHLKTEEVALWFLFRSWIGLQPIAEAGFSVTFSRLIAYGMGGATDLSKVGEKYKKTSNPNWIIIHKIVMNMNLIYLWLSMLMGLLFILLGSISLITPISYLNAPNEGWLSWGIVICTLIFCIYGSKFSVYLIGTNNIPILRRWETFTALGSIITNCIVLLISGNLIFLAISNQVWMILFVIICSQLCKKVEGGKYKQFFGHEFDKEIFNVAWPSAWRSVLGQFMSYGMVQISGLVYAQVALPAENSSYQLALRLYSSLRSFANAPFYSQLPKMVRLYSEGKRDELIYVARRGMFFAYWTFVFGMIIPGVFAGPILKLIHSNADFVATDFWALMGIGFMLDRFGAMHIQLYSVTNHIIWHISNGITGVIFYIVSLPLLPSIGAYAFLIGNIVANIGFYTWYNAKHSYKTFKLNFWKFEIKTFFPTLSIVVLYYLFTVFQ